MFVPKVPRRYDFCGCPPCALCFDWVEPVPPQPTPEEEQTCEPVRVDGIDKAAMDLTGKPLAEITNEEKGQVRAYMDDFHQRAFINAMKGTTPPEDGAFFVEGTDLTWFEQRIKQKAESNNSEKKYQENLKKPKVLDHIDMTNVEDEEKEKKEKLLQEEAKKEASKENRRKQEQEAARQRLLNSYQGMPMYDPLTGKYL